MKTTYDFDVSGKPLKEIFSLKGKTAVITGAAQGIGAAIARRLAEAGADIIIGDLDNEKATTTAKEIGEQYQIKGQAYEINIGKAEAIHQFFDHFADQKIDIWVNNAGIYPFSQLLDVSDDDWDNLMNINLKGTFISSREIAKKMIAQKDYGVIINIASTAALKTAGNSGHYVASKHAVAGLTKSLAVELGGSGIRALTVAPTLVKTPGTDKLKSQSEDIAKGLEEFAGRLPLGRMAYPDDIARVVLFAASELSMFMTGSVLPVDGGEISF